MSLGIFKSSGIVTDILFTMTSRELNTEIPTESIVLQTRNVEDEMTDPLDYRNFKVSEPVSSAADETSKIGSSVDSVEDSFKQLRMTLESVEKMKAELPLNVDGVIADVHDGDNDNTTAHSEISQETTISGSAMSSEVNMISVRSSSHIKNFRVPECDLCANQFDTDLSLLFRRNEFDHYSVEFGKKRSINQREHISVSNRLPVSCSLCGCTICYSCAIQLQKVQEDDDSVELDMIESSDDDSVELDIIERSDIFSQFGSDFRSFTNSRRVTLAFDSILSPFVDRESSGLVQCPYCRSYEGLDADNPVVNKGICRILDRLVDSASSR